MKTQTHTDIICITSCDGVPYLYGVDIPVPVPVSLCDVHQSVDACDQAGRGGVGAVAGGQQQQPPRL